MRKKRPTIQEKEAQETEILIKIFYVSAFLFFTFAAWLNVAGII